MKIEAARTYLVPVPAPHKGGRNWVFVELVTDEGVSGVGECTWHGMQGGSTVELIREFGRRNVLGSDPFDIERLWWDIYNGHSKRHTGPLSTPALSAIEIACWDIVGKVLKQPIYNLLGGSYNQTLRSYTYLYGWHVGDPPEQAAEDTLRYVEMGFTAVKFDPFGDLLPHELDTLRYVTDVVRSVREAVGDRCDILIGTHGQLPTSTAIRFARRVEEYDPLWFEEPVAPENVVEMARVAASTSIPIATGERLLTRYEYVDLLRTQAASIVQMDLSSTGGILEGKKIAAMADSHYARIAPHLWGGPVSGAAAIQLDVCTPNFLIQESIETWGGFHAEVLREPIRWENGSIMPSEKPGLGVEIDTEMLQRHATVTEDRGD